MLQLIDRPTAALSLPNCSELPKLSQLPKLSEREYQVLKLIVAGQTNPEIAATLYLSLSTVKTHIRMIFKKFGVNDRLQAALFALRHRLIELP